MFFLINLLNIMLLLLPFSVILHHRLVISINNPHPYSHLVYIDSLIDWYPYNYYSDMLGYIISSHKRSLRSIFIIFISRSLIVFLIHIWHWSSIIWIPFCWNFTYFTYSTPIHIIFILIILIFLKYLLLITNLYFNFRFII